MQRVCVTCNRKMVQLKNWKTKYTGDVQHAYFETFSIFANRTKNIFMKGTGYKTHTPMMFVCRNCGKMELYFDREDLEDILNVENDADYIDGEIEQTITDINMQSRLRQKTSANNEYDNEKEQVRVSKLKQRIIDKKTSDF